MKRYKGTLWILVLSTVLVGCADYIDVESYSVDKPVSVSQYEYLDAYGPLKSYIDRAAHPGFLLGAGVTVDDYLKKGRGYQMINSNFDQMTAGNAMKYSFVVADDGSMNLGTISNFVQEARAAGMQIYGHTLCWHAQQNLKWLNSLIADKDVPSTGEPEWENLITNGDCEGDDVSCFLVTEKTLGPKDATFGAAGTGADGIGRSIEVTSGDNPANPWDTQLFITTPKVFAEGEKFRFSMKAKASNACTVSTQAQKEPGNYHHWNMFGDIHLTTEWQTIEKELTVDGEQAGLQTIAFNLSEIPTATTYYFDDIVLEVEKKAEASIPVYIIDYDFFNGGNMIGWGNSSTQEVINGVQQLTNPSEKFPWDVQAGYDFTKPMEPGTRYFLRVRIKGSKEGTISAFFQNPENYAGCGDFNNIQLTTDWTEQTVSTTCTGENATRFLFNYGDYAGTIYIDEIAIYWEKSANTIPLTKEEKIEILTNEMERWVKGMMDATEGYVNAWDVVNEPLQDGYPWGQRYALKSEALNNDPDQSFYWQDYLGENYVRVPILFARKYFAENGGDPNDLKLFINDYNLESDWDDNQKLKSLISWIEQWESDGETRIDGIGTQMHISYHLNPETQASKEKHVVNMLELLASTGKLVRITELDMGLVDEEGETLKTVDTTLEQKMLMGDFYKFIINKYYEIIPPDQQYGICQWCTTDSPEDSGWRPGEPVGLWDLVFNRKPAYGGFADGLAGKK